MRKISSHLALLFLVMLPVAALGGEGAVSGGGGGTTNPEPAIPEYVSFAAIQYGPLLVSWLNRQEGQFVELSAEKKPTSPFAKLFSGPRTIFDVVRQTKIELRMTKPCYDAEGKESDASIYASQPGAICLSPFRMAPKLNATNVNRETVALLIHELCHLMGSDEADATVIQQQALWDFNRLDPLGVVTDIDVLANPAPEGDVAMEITEVRLTIENPSILSTLEMRRLQDDLVRLLTRMEPLHEDVRFLRAPTEGLFRPQLTKLQALTDFVCARDAGVDATRRRFCQEHVDRGFGAEAEVTARTYLSRNSKIDASLFEPTYDEVTIRKPAGISDVVDQLAGTEAYLRQVLGELQQLSHFHFDAYKY